MGDWERIFGPEHWDKLYLADDWAHNTRTWGAVLWFAAAGLVLAGIWWNWHRLRLAERGPRTAKAGPATPLAPVSAQDMWR